MTEPCRYVELHACSAFSFLEGGSLPEALAMTAAALGLSGMALLDKNGFYGSARFTWLPRRMVFALMSELS